MIEFDLSNYDKSVKQMHELGDSKFPFEGENSDGERTLVSVFKDKITMITFQHNDWIRTNTLYEDGVMEEMFER